ncbi:MAG: hypothetical protein H7293_19610 [Candidatus Saccharibacteria bacterium]|nr:hypothetical protein [Rhodoferax sp.]
MARVMCVWEQGSSLGHLSHLRSSVQAALAMGHEVFLVARELTGIGTVFGDLPITCLQAPFKQFCDQADQSAYKSLTHVIFRQCFSSAAELALYARAWRGLFELVKPDLVLYEHAPTALVASFGYPFKKILVGNGFSIPPRSPDFAEPFAVFMTTLRTPEITRGLQQDDRFLLQLINTVLAQLGSPQMQHLADLYAQADEQFLFTLAALDHFGPRKAQYLGVEAAPPQVAPVWPGGDGQKVFAYLSPVQGLEKLLSSLQAANVRALLVVRGLPAAFCAVYASEHLHFLDHLVDMHDVGQQADWIISHGNHISTALFMQSGVPQLLLPLHQEHLFVSLRLQAQGAAVLAYQDQPSYETEVGQMLNSEKLRQHAAALARQCEQLPKIDITDYIHSTIQRLLT